MAKQQLHPRVDISEKNPLGNRLKFGGIIVFAYLAGIGTFKAIQEIGGMELKTKLEIQQYKNQRKEYRQRSQKAKGRVPKAGARAGNVSSRLPHSQ